MRSRLDIRLTLLVGLPLLAAGCGSGTGSDSGALPARPGPAVPTQTPENFASLETLLTLPHAGVRRVEAIDRTVDPPRVIAYRERVMTDGNGHFSLDPMEAITPVAPDWTVFSLLQRIRADYVFRHRDFAIRDTGLFYENYLLIDLDSALEIAGRQCARYRVEHKGQAGGTYDVAVDVATGLVLSYEAFDQQGQSLVKVEYEIYDPTPDLSSFIPVPEPREIWELDFTWDLAVQINQHVNTPRVLPEGYALRRAVTLRDGTNQHWLRLTYTDGVESLFFLARIENPFRQANPITPGLVEVSAVTVFRMGTAQAAQGTFNGREFIAVGKVAEVELLDMIESALP